MTSTQTAPARPRRNGALLVGAAVLAAACLTLAVSTPALAVTSLSQGHVDVVYVDINQVGNKLVLGTNDEANGNYYEGATAVSDLSFTVPHAAWGLKTAGVATLLSNEAAAAAVPELWAGLAGSGDEDPNGDFGLRHFLTPGTHSIVLTLTGLTTPSGGSVQLVRNTSGGGSVVWFDSVGDRQSFGISASGDESYHQHTEWNFTKAGTYTLTFQASTNKSGVAASDPVTYTFDVQP